MSVEFYVSFNIAISSFGVRDHSQLFINQLITYK